MTAPSRLIIGPISTGLETYDKPFLINNDAFPTLENALCWRRRLIKKTGSEKLGQLQRSLITANMGATTISFSIVPASVAVPIPSGVSEFSVGSIVYTDADLTAAASVSLVTTAGSSGTLNRQTGAVTLNFPALAANTAVQYIPGLPVMGIEEFESAQSPVTPIDFPVNVFFDTVYSYLYNGTIFVDNSTYSSGAPVWWTGKNYQQFDTCNYFRAMFVTNNNPGAFAFAITSVSGGATPTVTVTLPAGVSDMALQTGDKVFINETTGAGSGNLNLNTFVITRTGVNTFTIPAGASAINNGTGVVFPLNRLVTLTAGGSAQMGDGIRWYDASGFNDFAPPLDNLSTAGSSTYLVGCRIIIPFGNRLLALGTFEATSAQILGGISIYYANRIRYCQVTATTFYANSPSNVTSTPLAWASNIQGYGGFIDLDTTERIISAEVTQGSLILGMESEQRKLTNTGIETDPFVTQVINPDYGSAGTHATIPMDKGILTVGEYGFITTSSYDAKRFDLPIIEQIFQVNPDSNGYERICGGRDFVNEVIYFSYPSIFNPQDIGSNPNFFPDTTIVYNYREPSFGIWLESATTYGLVKSSVASSRWASLTDFVWEDWDIPWNALPDSASTYPFVAFGTPQGFVMLKWANESTNDPSMVIQNISGPNADATYSITSVNFNLSPGMYVGFFPPAAGIPAFIGQVAYLGDTSGNNVTSIFGVNFDASGIPANIVPGTWQMSIVDLPFVQTKQFQAAWSNAKKTRIGAQKYFLDTTENGEFTVDILGSQNPTSLNNSTINNPELSLISNAIVRTRPDDSLGLYGTQAQQTQIWHRLASSCIGDTIQLQFSFSDIQMRNVDVAISPWILHSAILDLYPSRTLA
jgi:hypothetical protein